MNIKNHKDNGTSVAILILSIAGIGALVLGNWIWEVFVLVTK
jgi:hypothetical protein